VTLRAPSSRIAAIECRSGKFAVARRSATRWRGMKLPRPLTSFEKPSVDHST